MTSFNTYDSDIRNLVKFAKDTGFDEPEVMESVKRIEYALKNDLADYSSKNSNDAAKKGLSPTSSSPGM